MRCTQLMSSFAPIDVCLTDNRAKALLAYSFSFHVNLFSCEYLMLF